MTPRNMTYIVCVLGALQLLLVITLPQPFLRVCLNFMGSGKQTKRKTSYVLETECNRLSVMKYLSIYLIFKYVICFSLTNAVRLHVIKV